jgi:hypothetical protein
VRAPDLGRAFAWSRALATIDRLTGEIAACAKQTVRDARAARGRQPVLVDAAGERAIPRPRSSPPDT